MKYMGSKRAMLRNGLGKLLKQEIESHACSRFVDLFCGSAAVASHVGENYGVEVVATDLQLYGQVLANAVLRRTKPVEPEAAWAEWYARASKIFAEVSAPETDNSLTQESVWSARAWAQWFPEGTLLRAYAGHYFSPQQAAWLDALRITLPPREPLRSLCLGALVIAASSAAAAPGHTAQPFQPTPSAIRFIEISWKRSIPALVKTALSELAGRFALRKGRAHQAEANEFAKGLKRGDLVFVDPPYSGVHYSRFYHVLESVARGEIFGASGVGRYPPPIHRPASDYSKKTTARLAIEDLLKTLASRKVNVILTFPDHQCSNGLSGSDIQKIASSHFAVESNAIDSTFSTLGGGNALAPSRLARQSASELILVLRS